MMFNHERDIGGTADGTLKLVEDNIGLYAEAEITDPEVRAAAEKGQLRGWSFGFQKPVVKWDCVGKVQRRTIEDMELLEVSILTKTPAYFGTSVEMRSSETVEIEQRAIDDTPEVKNELPVEKRNISQEINNYKMQIAALECG